MATQLDIENQAREQLSKASPGYAGNQLRMRQPAANTELVQRMANAPTSSIEGVAARNIPLGNVSPTAAAVNPGTLYVDPAGQASPAINPNVSRLNPSREALDFADELKASTRTAAPVTAPTVAAPAVSAPGTQSLYQRITGAASEAAKPMVPSGGGAIGRVAATAAKSGLALAGRVAPYVAPAIETARVARVAMDPGSTGLDVATQAAEGVGRTASTIAGAGLGGAAGAAIGGPLAPVTGAIGSIAGGALGYFGGDQAIKALRRSVGLDDASPVDAADARAPVTQPAAKPVAPSSNVTPGPNGSTVQTNPDGSSSLVTRPTNVAPAAVTPAPAAPTPTTIAAVATQATQPKKARAVPVSEPAVSAPVDQVQAEADALYKARESAPYKPYGDLSHTANGLAGIFSDKDGNQFTNAAPTKQDKELAANVSILPARGENGSVFEQDGKQYKNVAIGTQAGGVPLIQAVSIGGKNDFGYRDAVDAYRDLNEAKLRLQGMTPEQKTYVDNYLSDEAKLGQLHSKLPFNPIYEKDGMVSDNRGVEVPKGVWQSGKAQEYIDAAVNGAVKGADPYQAKIDMELAGIQAKGKNERDVAGIHAGSAANVAGINERGSNYRADKVADAENWKMTNPKTDPFTGEVTPGVMYNAKSGEIKPVNSGSSAPPAVGTQKNGYRFKGGNPADQKNWEKI